MSTGSVTPAASTQQVSRGVPKIPPQTASVPQTVLYQPSHAAQPRLPVAVTDPSLVILQEGLCAKISVWHNETFLDLRRFSRVTENGPPVLAPGTSAQRIQFSKKGISLRTQTWATILPTLHKMLS